jgi:hypothetical protein
MMLANDPFADLIPPANDPGFTGYIPGTPKAEKPEEPPSGYRFTQGGNLEAIPGGPADKIGPDGMPAVKAQESERTAAYLATNLSANISLMNDALKIDPSAAKPTWGQWFAGLFGDTAQNLVSPDQRQVVLNNQRLITDAALTLGTGAAYTKEQIEAYRRGFFPQIGDSEAAVKAKHEALRAALIAAKLKAGSQAPKIDEAMTMLGMDPDAPLTVDPKDALDAASKGGALAMPATPPANATPPSGGDGGPGSSIGVSELTDEQKSAYAGFWKANPDPSPEQLTTFLDSIGVHGVTNASDIIKAEKAGAGYTTTRLDTTYRSKVEQRVRRERELGNDDSAAKTLLNQGATLNLSDEASGVGNALANAVTSPFTSESFDPIGSYALGRDAERLRIADAREQLGYGGTALELVGSVASMSPAGALEVLAPKEAARLAGRAGAIGGALSGFGAGEGAGDSATGAAGGALAGYAIGRFGPAIGERAASLLPRRFRAPRGMAPDVASAAEAEGVDLLRPMVDPNTISDFGALESNVYSQPIIRGAQARVAGQIEDRVAALGGTGTALETEAAGGKVQDAARRFIKRSKGVANSLYDRARSLSGDARFVPEKAIAAVDEQIAALSANAETNSGEIAFLNGLKKDLSTPGGKSIEELRQLRQSLRGRINEQNLGATQAEARAMQALDATQLDAAINLPKGAATAYRRADTYYRERQVHIDDILDRFLGGNIDRGQARLSGEQAFQRLKSMTSPGGDGRRLAALMRDLEPGERQDIAATIAQSLGRRSSDEPFSTALFLSQTRKLSPSARRTIFGPDGAQSIDNLRLLSRKLEEAGKDINRSRTATVLERQGWRNAARSVITALAGIGGTAATGSVAGGAAGLAVAGTAMGASAARRLLSARAMVNPRVSRWLAEAADISTERQAKEATRKLGVIIAREPAIAHELKPVYEALQQRLFTPNPMPLAAEPQTEGNDDDR